MEKLTDFQRRVNLARRIFNCAGVFMATALVLAFVDMYIKNIIVLALVAISAFLGIVFSLISKWIIDKNNPEWERKLDEQWEDYFKNKRGGVK